MKKLLFLFVASFSLMVIVPAPVEASICKCGNQAQFSSLSETDCCTQCATHGNTNLRGYPARYADTTDLDDLEVIACTNLNKCWCASSVTIGACVAIEGQYVASQTACTDLCRSRGSVSRHFDSTGNYAARSGPNMCGNYCWCREPVDGGFACNNHVTSPLILSDHLGHTDVAMVTQAECSALCTSLRGTVGGFESTYQAERDPDTCAPKADAPAAGPGPTAPTGPVRLFNPLAGASTIVDIINRVINMIMGTVGAGALLMFIYGGMKWMTAGGDSKNVSEAQMILKNATLGILLLMFSYTIIATFFSLLR